MKKLGIFSILISLIFICFRSERLGAVELRTVLPSISSITSPVDGELAFDSSVNGPVLRDQGKWKSFTPVADAHFPDYKVTATTIAIAPESSVLCADQTTLLTNRSETSVVISSLIGTNTSGLAIPGWNAIFAVPVGDGTAHFKLVLSKAYPVSYSDVFTPPSGTYSGSQYRYIGSMYLNVDNSGLPLVKKGNQFFYRLPVSVPTPSPTQDATNPTTTYAFPDNTTTTPVSAPFAQVISITGLCNTVTISGHYHCILGSYYNGASSDYTVFNNAGPAPMSFPFDQVDLLTATDGAPFGVQYQGTLQDVFVVRHIEDPVLFSN